MYVCMCKAVSEAELQAVVATAGPSLEKVQKSCGAGTDCGACTKKVESYLSRHCEQEARSAKGP